MRQARYQRIVQRFRDETRQPATSAPPWVVAVVDALAAWKVAPRDVDEAVAWCEAGEPVTRAEHLLTVVSLWPGRKDDALVAFLRVAFRHRAGRARGTLHKPVRAVRVRESWQSEPWKWDEAHRREGRVDAVVELAQLGERERILKLARARARELHDVSKRQEATGGVFETARADELDRFADRVERGDS